MGDQDTKSILPDSTVTRVKQEDARRRRGQYTQVSDTNVCVITVILLSFLLRATSDTALVGGRSFRSEGDTRKNKKNDTMQKRLQCVAKGCGVASDNNNRMVIDGDNYTIYKHTFTKRDSFDALRYRISRLPFHAKYTNTTHRSFN